MSNQTRQMIMESSFTMLPLDIPWNLKTKILESDSNKYKRLVLEGMDSVVNIKSDLAIDNC